MLENLCILLIDFFMLFVLPFFILCIIDYVVILKYNKKSLIKRLFNDL